MADVSWSGMDELYTALNELPGTLSDEVTALARSSATEMVAALKIAYPRGKDHKGKRLLNEIRWGAMHLADANHITERMIGQYHTSVRVVNTSAYVWAFESGRRKGRHGTTPARPTFIPIRARFQREYYDLVVTLLEAKGLAVSGDPES